VDLRSKAGGADVRRINRRFSGRRRSELSRERAGLFHKGLWLIYFPYNRFTKPLSSISFKIEGSIKSLGLSPLA